MIVSRLRLADRETMAIETLHVREASSRGCPRTISAAFVLRPAQRHVRDRDRRRHADDRAHRDERGGVRCAGRPAASSACFRLSSASRAHRPVRSSSMCAIIDLEPHRRRAQPPARDKGRCSATAAARSVRGAPQRPGHVVNASSASGDRFRHVGVDVVSRPAVMVAYALSWPDHARGFHKKWL